MTEVVSIRFRNRSKCFYFDPRGEALQSGQHVIVETSKGQEFATCCKGNFEVDDDKIVPPLRRVIRAATQADIAHHEENVQKEERARRIFIERAKTYGLEMKLVDVELNFDGSKLRFFFTADGRVDFRELVRDLSNTFRTRIELRQVGVRDETRIIGGLGSCGKPFCCSQFLNEFQPVSIKMAKMQNLSLNPSKISGTCGRLMCCLKYEQDVYEKLTKNAPRSDSYVQTPEGAGLTLDVNILRQTARVRMDSQGGDPVIAVVAFDDITFIKSGKARRAELAANPRADEAAPARHRKLASALEPTQPAAGEKKPRPPRPKKPKNPAVNAETSAQSTQNAPKKEGDATPKKPNRRRRRRPNKPNANQNPPKTNE